MFFQSFTFILWYLNIPVSHKTHINYYLHRNVRNVHFFTHLSNLLLVKNVPFGSGSMNPTEKGQIERKRAGVAHMNSMRKVNRKRADYTIQLVPLLTTDLLQHYTAWTVDIVVHFEMFVGSCKDEG